VNTCSETLIDAGYEPRHYTEKAWRRLVGDTIKNRLPQVMLEHYLYFRQQTLIGYNKIPLGSYLNYLPEDEREVLEQEELNKQSQLTQQVRELSIPPEVLQRIKDVATSEGIVDVESIFSSLFDEILGGADLSAFDYDPEIDGPIDQAEFFGNSEPDQQSCAQ